ncbi:hypothetical protein AAFN47_01945 [Hoeflea sp. CAU 1731]
MGFVDKIDLTNLPVVAKSNFNTVLDLYHNREREGVETSNRNEYPFEVEVAFERLILEMHDSAHVLNGDIPVEEDVPDEGESDDELASEMGLYTGSGYLIIDRVAEMLWTNPKVIWAFTQPIIDQSIKYSKDISYVLYNTLDYSNYNLRILIFSLYSLGFFLLSIPTIRTFYKILSSAILSLF